MNYPEIGQTVEIHSYKHNSKIHRIWHETTILDISDEVVIGANNKTLVISFIYVCFINTIKVVYISTLLFVSYIIRK